jgi:rubredoxin
MDQQKIFRIWMAGFYEGEGSISNDKSNNNRLRLSISQNDKTPLVKAQEIWNGSLKKRIRKSPVSDKICTGFEWRLSHNDSLRFIEDIKPYMIIPYKINQINDALKSAKNGYSGKFKCNFCNLEYASPSGRRMHEKKEHINQGKLHKCSICSLEYKSKDSLNRHIRLKHSNKNSDASVNNISI